MKLIDDKLGGTTPLDIIVKFPDIEKSEKTDDDFDSWDDEEKDEAKYWFTRNKINRIISVHDYLDNLQEVGKVISFASMVRVAEDLSGGKELQGLEMGILYTKIPDSIKKEIIDPYISIKNNEARISLRVLDSKKDLRRNELINKISKNIRCLICQGQSVYDSQSDFAIGMKLVIKKKIEKKKTEIRKLQELYSKPESIPGEVKTQIASKIKEKKIELKNLYSSPKKIITLEKTWKWATVQIAKLFLGIPIVPGK